MDPTTSGPSPAVSPGPESEAAVLSETWPVRLAFALVLLLFIASGLSSLIYQVVWTRLLVLVFGSTTFATATVLAVFMAGLALGSYLAGRVSDRLRRPFLFYGVLEGIIGIWALLVPSLLEAASPIYRLAWQQFHLSLIPFSLLRFAMASIVLIVPTACMGATLPLLSRFVTTSLDFVGRRVGTLYAVNTLGAVAGAALAGFVLLPRAGLTLATIFAALINFTLCGLVILVAPALERPGSQGGEVRAPKLALTFPVKLAMIAFALSGALAMIYEVCWTRALLMVIGSTTYAFTIMLSTFLFGIFLGSLICARLVDKAREPLIWFAILEILVCLSGISGIVTFNFLPWWSITISSAFPHDPGRALLVRLMLSSLIMVPLTLCLGAIFPAVVKVATRELEAVGRSVGKLYAVNTLGAIAGAFLAGFALVPAWGVEKALIWASVANLVLGLVLLLSVKPVRLSVKVATVAASLPLIFWLAHSPALWDKVVLMSCQSERRQLVKRPVAHKSFAHFRRRLKDDVEELFWEDGASSTVAVARYRASRQRSLVTNGHVDASDGQGDMNTQVLLAAYPLLWKPDAHDVAVIGWGAGVSVGTATAFPVRSIVAVELEPAVVRASKFFHHVNRRAEENKIVRIEYNDGRNFLLATDQDFDVIVSEPSNPWQAGVCNLFTREYFQICRQRLRPGGIFSFWLQIAEIPPRNLRGILKSLNSVFPHTLALLSDPGNLVILASDRPLSADPNRVESLTRQPPVAETLAKVDIGSSEAVLARLVAASDGLRKLAGKSRPNVDDTNRLEYAVGRTYETDYFGQENARLLAANPGNLQSQIETGHLAAGKKAELFASIGREAQAIGHDQRALYWANASLEAARSPEGLNAKASALYELGRRAKAMELWDDCLESYPRYLAAYETRGMMALSEGDLEAARRCFLSILEIEPFNRSAQYHMAQTYAPMSPPPAVPTKANGVSVPQEQVSPKQVLHYLSALMQDREFVKRHPDVLYMAGVANYQLGRTRQAESLIRDCLELQPQSAYGLRMLGCILFKRGAIAEANSRWFASFVFGKSQAEGLFAQGQARLREGRMDAAIDLFEEGLDLWPGDEKVYSTLTSLAPGNPRAAQLVESVKTLAPIFPDQGDE